MKDMTETSAIVIFLFGGLAFHPIKLFALKNVGASIFYLARSGFAHINRLGYQVLENLWLGVQPDQNWQEYLRYLMFSILIVFLILAMIVFTRTLQRRANQRTRDLKKALEDLQKSERQYREIFNTTNEAIFIHAVPDGRVLHVNEAMLKMYGYESEEEVISRGFNGLFAAKSPYSAADALKKIQWAVKEGPQIFEWLARRKNGENFWVEVSLQSSQISGEGQILAVVRDITERKRAKEALQDSHDRLLTILDGLDADIYVADMNTYEILFMNRHIRENFGGDLVGQTCWQVFRGGTRLCPHCTNEKLVDADGNPTGVYIWEGQNPLTQRWYINYDRAIRWIDGRLVRLQIATDITERKRVDEALYASEERYRTLFDNMMDGIYRSTHEGRFVDVNPAMVRMFGYSSREEMLAVDIKNELYFSPEERGSHILDTGQEEIEVYRMRRKDGSEIWVEDHGHYVHDEQGNIVFHEGMLRDVTARKQMEDTLRENERRLLETQRIAHIGSWEWDLRTGETRWSSENYVIHGLSQDSPSLAPDTLIKYIHPDDLEKVNMSISQAISDGKPVELDYHVFRPDGSMRVIHAMGAVTEFDAEGRPALMLGTNQDITERKRAEEALRESEELYRKMNENSPLGMHFYRLEEGRLIFTGANPAADVLLKVDNSQFIGKPIEEAFPPLIETEAPQRYRDAAEKGIPWSAEQITYEDRQIRGAFEVRAFQTTQGNMVAVFADITARKQAEQQLHERERQYRTLVEQIPAVVYIDELHNGLNTVYVSPQVEKILGYTPREWMENSPGLWESRVHPEDFEFVHEKYLRCAKDGEPFEAEYRLRTADGRFIWLQDQAVMLRDENGNPQFVHGVLRDISAHRQAEEEMHQRVTELETLHESGLIINQLLDPREIGQKVIELLKQKLDWHHTAIRLYHPQDESLELLAFNQPAIRSEAERREVAERFRTLISHTNQGVSGWAVRHKQVVKSNDLPHDPRYVDIFPNLQSGLYVPMLIGDRVVGVISIESERPNAFSSSDERLAATLANQAASALENARLFEQTERRFQEFAALYETSNILSSETELNSMLLATVEHSKKLLDAASTGIYLYFRESDELILTVAISPYSITGTRLKLGEGLAGHVAKTRKPLCVNNYSTWENRSLKYEGMIFHATLGVPMLYGGELIGVIMAAETDDPLRKFTEADERLLSLFASQAAGAIHSTRLFEETKRRFREFAALYDTSSALAAETDLSDLLQVIVEHARRLLKATTSGIYLYLSESNELELTVDTAPYLPIGTHLRLGEGAAGRVAQTRQPIRLDDYSTWEGRSRQYEKTPIRAVIEVPMLYGGELIGVLTADEIGNSERKFTEADERLLSLFASQAAGAIHSTRLREQTARRLDQLQALHTIDRAISSSFDLRPILHTVITQAIVQLSVDAVDVLLYHPHLQRLEYVAGQGFRSHAIEQTRLRLGECFSGRAAFERRTIHVPNLTEVGLDFTRAAMLKAEGFMEFYAVPLIAKGEVKGVLEVFHRTTLSSNLEWLDFLETLAEQAAITIDQTQLFDNLQRANLELVIAYDATIEGWARAMDLRDKETESHTERVTELTISLAGAMGVKDGGILNIRRGALLHDIGKMGVPDNILLKEGNLTEEEWKFMRRHPQFAYEMLQPIKYLQQALDIPYCHHEKWDGTGYPRGLKGEQIPLAARIFAIADVWDALTSDRPYRKAWTKEEALSYIKEQGGKQFDPKVVKAFLRMIER